MLQFPVRKCFHVFKICLLLVLVVTILAMFEQWRGGKRSARAQYSDPAELEYERQIQEDEARIIPGLGEGGVAAHLMGEDKRLGEESEKKLAINVHLSDRIAYNRTLKDYRNPACQRVVYDAELPSASVVIIFHNEPYSVVVRTIWSVVNSARRDNPWFQKANYVDRATGRTMTLGYRGQDPNSRLVYLKEIILVDDNSTLPELKGKLSHYVRTRLPPDLIRILRLPDRQGLIAARLRGARSARGDALIFLDAHCEVAADWLRPLLQRLRHKRDAVVTPVIDIVDQNSFEWLAATQFQVGGFSFMGHFTWIEVPEREKKRRGSDISPTWSPTMAGGLFAIDRAYYWEIGAYDEQMAGWGGENLEMSFRIWMCGGTLETIPCSRVGHVFRSFHPYGLPAHTDTHGINTARMAEVWMDEYAELFYLHRPDLRNNPKIGDVTHRKVLREKLRCKSFQWYLDNIYREKFVPVRDVYGYGRFKNPPSNMCLDTLQREGNAAALGIYPCHSRLQATQYFSLSSKGELRDEESCAELQHAREEGIDKGRRVLMADCHGKRRGQKWHYLPTGQLQHVDSGLCLDAGFEAGADVLVRTCQDSPAQRWEIDYSQDNNFHLSNDVVPNSLEERLSKLRSQRRISRSLLSSSVDNATARRRTHKRRGRKRAKKHKRRVKNKFILKLVRTLPNNSEEHLEVDIHCSHKRLYPNNSFVRDLVSVLNDKDIKVINNGRVFEKNKVTELSKAAPRERKVLHKLDIAERTDPQPSSPPQPLPPIQPKKPLKKRKPGHVIPLVQPDTHPPTTHKKIIIEDFVEVPAALPLDQVAPQRAQKRRKKKRTRTTPPVTEPATPDRSAELTTAPDAGAEQALEKALEQAGAEQSEDDREALLNLLSHKRGKGKEDVRVTRIYSAEEVMKAEQSAEDAPMVSSGEVKRHAASTEMWPIGESRFRSNDTDAARRKARRDRINTDLDTDRDSNDRFPDRLTDRDRDYERGRSERDRDSDRGRESDRDRNSDRGRESDRDRNSDRGRESDRDRNSDRGRESDRDRNSDRGRESDRDRNSDRGRESERDRDSDRGRESERDRDSDRGRESERERESDRDHRERYKDRNNEVMSEGEPGVYNARHALMDRHDSRDTKPVEDKRTTRMQQRADTLAGGGGGGTGAPVKLVMRSNLTFNLGDEFFAWRAHPDNNEVIDELTIPSNDSHTIPLAKAWPPPDADRNPDRNGGLDRNRDRSLNRNPDRNSDLDHDSGRSREQEHIITGNGVGSPREASEEDSSASDSGDHS